MPKGKFKMSKTPSKRQGGVLSIHDYKPKSSMSLEGEHAAVVKDHPIGRKVKFEIHATKVSHNMGSEGGKMSHSARYELHKVIKSDNEATDEKQASKPDGKPSYTSKQDKSTTNEY